MRTRLTLRGRGGRLYDVEIRSPYGTTIADLRAKLDAAVGQSPRRRTPGTAASLWAGSRALPADALLGGAGLRSGSIVGVDEPGPRDSVSQAILRLHVAGGPDAGAVYALPRGIVTVGRGVDCDVRLSDIDCSREHLELTVSTAGISVRDLDSTNGTLLLADDGSEPEPVNTDGRPVSVGQYLAIGNSIVSVATVTSPSAATSMAQDGTQLVNRPPRLSHSLAAHTVEFPEMPGLGTAAALPWLAALIPALGGGALAWFLHNVQFLAFVVLSPILMLATSVGERVSGRRSRRRERHDHRAKEFQADTELLSHSVAETRFRRSAHPDPAELVHVATTPSARIWERRRHDADFLDVRVGLADRPAWLRVRRGSQLIDPPMLRSVPVWTNLRNGALGVCGPRPLALGVARWTVSQLVALHSPADLHLVALLDDVDAPAWSWLRWLPHLSAPGDAHTTMLARTPEQRCALLAGLLARAEGFADTGRPWTGPWTVLIIDRASAVADTPGLGRVLSMGSAVGITALCLDDEQRRLPPSCTSVVRLTGETGSRIRVRVSSGSTALARLQPDLDEDAVQSDGEVDVLADHVRPVYADRIARALAPLADPGADAASALPGSVRLWDLLELDDLEPTTLAARWERNDGRAFTPLGVSTDGVFSIDLGRDGPHALVAGTTGAGKSELLQSIVAGLAVQSGPEDLQFVLIDYKGGAAFADCAQLPHTAGLVTDLDGHLTERALRSLEAELKRREKLFAQAGTAELAGYRASAVHPLHPLGRLVLVVDEFAALAEELPDFVTGIVGIAQRGRSLGVHLILATQRPAGVISPEIRANVGMKIALRVTDAAESSDVLGSDDAAWIQKSTPGRAVVGIGTTLSPVQIGRIAAPVVTDAAGIDVVALDEWGVPLPSRSVSGPGSTEQPETTTDLQVLVAALSDAARVLGRPAPRRPWLEPLGAIVDSATLADAHRAPSSIVIGARDLPGEQAHRPVVLDLDYGEAMLLVGGARSGRTSTLRTIAALAADALPVSQVHVYGIDCASGGLRVLDALPHCGAVVGRDSPASIARLVQLISREVERRAGLLAELGVGTAAEARALRVVLPTMLLLLDGWEGFLDAVEDVDNGQPVDSLLALLRDGAAVGLLAVVAGDRAALASRLAGAVSRRYVLRLSDSADYAMAGLSRNAIPTEMPPGRAVDALDSTELQFAVLGRDPTTAAQNAVIADIADRARERSGDTAADARPMMLRVLPTHTRLADLELEAGVAVAKLASVHQSASVHGLGSVHPAGAVLLGVGGDAATALGVNLLATADASDARLLIAGPSRSGRSTVLTLLATQLSVQADQGVLVLVLAAGPRSGLRRWADAREVPVLTPDARGLCAAQPAFEPLMTHAQPTVLLIDDCESFLDAPVGDWLTDVLRAGHGGLAVVASGRSEDLSMAFRGIAAELKRARTGLLLQPGPGDGDVLGISLPLRRPVMPVGRGLLVAPGTAWSAAYSADSSCADGAPAHLEGAPLDDDAPIPIQLALP